MLRIADRSERQLTMSFLKTSAIVGSLTIASRLLGFVRDLLVAFLLGTDFVAEAFFVAQRLPNLFRALFAEGAFNNAFVPQFSGRLEGEGRGKAFRFAHDIYSFFGASLLAFCASAIFAMPWLIHVIAPGFSHSTPTLQLAIELTRICFPYLFFISLVALLSGLLNSLGHFAAPAFAPVLMNVVIITFCVVAWQSGLGATPDTARLLSYSVTLSGLLQWLLLAALAGMAGFKILPALPRLTPDVRAMVLTAVPGILSGGISQINLTVATALASGMAGGVAFLYYAERLFEFPLGVIGVTIGVVLLPAISRKLRANEHAGVQDYLNRGLELSMLLTLPATAALILLSRPILHTVFEHGAFGPTDTSNVAPALAAFATSLPAFTVSKVLQPLFYARHDMKTPMYFAIVSAVVNITASFILAHFLMHTGIALATSIAAWINALLLLFTSLRRGHFVLDPKLGRQLPRMAISTVIMTGVMWWLMGSFFHGAFLTNSGNGQSVMALAVLLLCGTTTYFLSAVLTKAVRLSDLLSATG